MTPDTQRDTQVNGVFTVSDFRTAALYVAAVVALFLVGVRNGSIVDQLLGNGFQWPSWTSLTLMLVAALFTVFRSTRPEILLVVVVPLCMAEILLGSQISAYVLLVEGLWAPVAKGSARTARLTTWVGVVLGGLFGGSFLIAVAGQLPWTSAVVMGVMLVTLIIVTPLTWAWEVRRHREAQQAAEELARMEHELAGERAAREVGSERLRIAQDLHDVVAGHLTAVTLHTNLATDLPDDDARTQSLHTARDSAEAALRDLRSVIDVLADGGDDPLRRASLSWDTLHGRLGEDADVSVDPAVDDPDRVPASTRSALLHIAAEAVTNALHHGSSPRSLHVTVGDDEVTMNCGNAFSPAQSPDTGSGGIGLSSMSNRAAAVGGTVTAGPDSSDPTVWTVTAQIPRG